MTQFTDTMGLSRFDADLAGALTRRGQSLLEAVDLPQQVAAMAPLEFYYVVKELGVEDAQAILCHGSAQQLQACCDLDCWERDDFSPVELDAWLAGFAAQGTLPLANAFLLLDVEVQILFLAESLAIYDIRSEPIPDLPDEIPYKQTVDGFFGLFAVTEEREVPLFLLVEALYENSIEEAFRLLMAAKWELKYETTETAFHFRSGRLEEMGFLGPAEAARLFAPPPPALSWPPPGARDTPGMPDLGVVTLPALYATALAEPTSRLSRALALVRGADVVARLETELVTLINAATVAYGNATKDLSGVMRVATYVRDTLSLGLEACMAAQADQDMPAQERDRAAAAVLQQRPMLHLFQAGFAVVRPLQQAARALSSDPVVAAWLNVGLHPDDDEQAADRAFLAALVQPRPLWAGTNPLHPQSTRAWQSLHDVTQSQARLEALGKRLL